MKWMEIAWASYGVEETAGPAATAEIVEMYREVGREDVTSDEVPWCAAFVGACLAKAGIKPGLAAAEALLARAYLKVGREIDVARPGAIAVFRRAGPGTGHVGFVVGASATHIQILGGNQANKVSVIHMPRAELLGLRWPGPYLPPDAGSSRTVAAANSVTRNGTASATAGTAAPLVPPVVPPEVAAAASRASEVQGVVEQMASFGTFLGTHLWLVLGLMAVWFGLRAAREGWVIAWLRAEDTATGAHVDRAAEQEARRDADAAVAAV